ncbi:hypothetical protein [Kitasatospora sp. GP82]|uniref:hypothetical protein n=1 Tax=Kitasatospora sp. GP82 TaxID=3035089 RepID=UPI0024730952|nr:hypothetical protein [Kitasatospora sp. GP82]MDH6124630.1 hypothetical protein [Kitasatospora sp. GP82]
MTNIHTRAGHFRSGESVPAMIPGVVDGMMTTSLDAEGNVSFHILISEYGRSAEISDRVEFILTGEHARQLGETLLARAQDPAASTPEASPVPCSVGVRLSSIVGAV